jgi:hypothetical protein|tara:strand:+ start:198 stop:374 length:177 start_codon:yes stop_codon:yes gene_type:complete
MNDNNEKELFINLQRLSSEKPEFVSIVIDEDGEVEFEIDLDFFLDNLRDMLGSNEDRS